MEPAGLAVGVIGLAGFFDAVLNMVDRAKTFQAYDKDTKTLQARFEGFSEQLRTWMAGVGLTKDGLAYPHSSRLDDDQTKTTVQRLLRDLLHRYESFDGLGEAAGGKQGSQKGKREKISWALWRKKELMELAEATRITLEQLRTLVPPGGDLATEARAKVVKMYDAETQRLVHAWILGSLTISPSATYEITLGKRIGNTCQWFTDLSQFQHWAGVGSAEANSTSPNTDPSVSTVNTCTKPVLWVNGPAGFGKTHLFAHVIHHLQQATNVPVAYFFFSDLLQHDRGDSSIILRSWLSQLSKSNTEIFELVNRKRLRAPDMQEATWLVVEQLLREALGILPRCYLAVDGLDECTAIQAGTRPGAPPTVGQFLDTVMDVMQLPTRLIIVSRPGGHIWTTLSPRDDVLDFKITRGNNMSDCAELCRYYVDNDKYISKKSQKERDQLSNAMKDKCDGQMLWIRLSAQKFGRAQSMRNLHKGIQETPKDLKQVYLDAWKKLEGDGRSIEILRWVTFARRPMTVEELSGAVLVREGNEDVFEYDLPEVDSDNGTDDGTGAQDPLVADILEPCGQFVELRQRPYGHQRNVHLVHETVREFLVSQLSTWPVWGNEGLGPTLAAEGLKLGNEPPSIEEAQHRILGRLCLWFVQSRSMWQLASLGDDVYEFQTWAFGDYAAACWDRHLASYTPLERDDATLQRIIDFMDATNTSWEAWQCWSANGCWIEDRGGTASSAVELRLYAVAATLIRQMSPGDEELCSARLLINCCRQGHVGLVDQVLDAGAYIDAAGIRGLTALHEAASRGYYDVVSRLVARGASVDPVANLGRTPLFYALRGGHLEIIGLLTDNGAKVTWDDSLMSNLIQHLAVNHAPDTVQFLMERAEVQANYLPHIAVAAAAAGNLDLLQCLLDKGVDICQNDNELPPLKMAVKNDHMETVAFLLAKGADVDGVTSRFSEQVMSDISIMRYASVKVSSSVGCSAMNIAIEADNLAMVRLLADAGADLDRLDISGCGPVHTAAMYGRLDILKLLAERGADMGAVLRRRRTVLHFAAEGGHLDVVAYLITCADAVRIDAVDDHGRTAVGLAAFRSNLDIARFLLSKGAGFSKIDKGTRFINKYHRNSKASSAPSAEAVSLLIENGADFNAADKHGMTGLDYAARIARLDLVEVLVDNGADVTRTDHHGRTAIHHAASYYTWWWRRLTPATLQKAVAQIIDLLLDHGADVDAADADGRTALHAAALKNGLTPIHRLCKRGANVNAVCAGGSTPLHLAAEKNNLHVVRALVRRGADTTIKNDDGETALDVAKRRGREAVVEYLEGLTRESGQDVHLQGP